MLLGEALKPVAHGPGRRHLRQATEPRDERVAGEILQVLQASGPRVEEREDQQPKARAAVIPTQRCTRSPQPRGERESLHRSEEHTSELQSPCNLVCRLLL